MELKGRAALVTGAGQRVGREIALELARLGADVAVHFNRSEPEAASTARAISQMGRRSDTFRADLASPTSIESMMDRVLATFPELAVLVNCAAVFYPTSVEELDSEAWDRILNVNLKAGWLCARRAGLHFRERGEGKIVNIGCVGSFKPWPGRLAYSVSKAGVVMMTESLALELAPQVQVNCVAPGTVLFHEGATESHKQQIRSAVPMKREGEPQDISRTVGFLVTGPDYITGQTLVVDGGRLLR